MIGRQLAHFELIARLGQGGMGVVYEAIDRHLDRHVALKVLPAEKVMDPGRKERFIREAKAASALNHPNIVAIYDISSADNIDYIAMELVVGRTLEEILAKRRLKLPEALRYAVQIARAIAAAHSAGVIHRDLKPGNLMVTENGIVKVLDFGLAKLNDRPSISEDDATLTMTEEGIAVGTLAYMSPEQAEGRNVDARSDIFSFGLVLYEMLSGKRAFGENTAIATLAAILHKEPQPLSELVPDLPRELDRIVARCLRKDRTRRSHSMAEISIALQDLEEEAESDVLASTAAVRRTARGRRRWTLGATAVILCTALFFVIPRQTRTQLKEVPLTSYVGYQGQPTLSPDGSQFAFVWDGGQENAPPQLYIRLVGGGTPLRLTSTPGAGIRYPAWSPDGQAIAFVRINPGTDPGELVVIPALGGPERRIDGAAAGIRPAWSPDGKWLYFSANVSPQTRALFVQPSTGGERHLLIDPPAGGSGDVDPSLSPDGRYLVFVRQLADYNADLFVADLTAGRSAGKPRRLTNDHRNAQSPVWAADGKEIVYVSGESTSLLGIYRVRVTGGYPKRVEGIGGDYAQFLAIAPRAHRLVYSRSYADHNIYRMSLPSSGGSTGAPVRFLSSTRFEDSPTYAPNGRRIAFSSNRDGVRQIWVADVDGSNPVALTNFAGGVAGSPKWSPDAQTIVFDARPEGLADIYSISAQGGAPRRLTDHPAEDHLPCYSTDGRWIYFASTRAGLRQLYRISSSGGEAVQITRQGGLVSVASPDGKWVYYTKGGGAIWRVLAGGGDETPVLAPGTLSGAGNNSLFNIGVARSGIYFAGAVDAVSRARPLKLYRFTDGKVVEIGRFNRPLRLQFSISPDEKWLAYAQLDSSVDDLMLVENFR